MNQTKLSHAMMGAVARNDKRAVDEMLASGAGIDDQDDNGWTALTHALQQRRLAIVASLRARGARLRLVDFVLLGDVASVRRELAINPDRSPSELKDLVRFAAPRGYGEILGILLGLAAGRSLTSSLAWPMQNAACNGHVEVVRILVEASGFPSPAAAELIDIAVFATPENGQADVLWYLLAWGLAVPESLGPALVVAARDGHLEVLRLLLDQGVDVNYRLEDGSTPLMAAAFSGHIPVLSSLLEAGADRNLCRPDDKTALDLAEAGPHDRAAAILRE